MTTLFEQLAFLSSASPAAAAAADDNDLSTLRQRILQSKEQLDEVPKYIQSEQWDSIRSILITSPLADCWTQSSDPKFLRRYAEAIGNSNNDMIADNELDALEARESLMSHLRYLDMAVYNNVFNPIKTEGETGATKELIRSYYEDPMKEWKASMDAMTELIRLATPPPQ